MKKVSQTGLLAALSFCILGLVGCSGGALSPTKSPAIASPTPVAAQQSPTPVMATPSVGEMSASGQYTDKVAGYTFQAPKDWKAQPDTARQVGASAIVMGPNQGPNFKANINVMVQNAPDLKTYTDNTHKQLKDLKANVVSEKDLKSGSVESHQIVWKAKMRNMDMQFCSTYFAKEGKVFLMTGTSLADKYKDVAKSFEATGSSFTALP